MIRVAIRRPDDSDEDWNRRRQLAPLREQVRRRRDEYTTAVVQSATSRRVLRWCTAGLLLGVLLVLLGVALVFLGTWVDGFGGAVVASFVVGGVASLVGIGALVENWDDHANHAAPLAIARRAYDEALADYIDSGGGTDLADSLLTLDRT